MTGLPFIKLYVDTSFTTTDSISNTDFKYQLRVPASMPANATFCIDEINIPYAWNTVEVGVNDKLYVGWQLTNESQLGYTLLTIPPRRYTGAELATQLQNQLNTESIVWVFFTMLLQTQSHLCRLVCMFSKYSPTAISPLLEPSLYQLAATRSQFKRYCR